MKKLILAITCLLTSQAALAQSHDLHMVEHQLFPPEAVMAHQRAIELTDEQSAAIREQVKDLQNKMTDWQWELQKHTETFHALIKASKPDEDKVVAGIQEVLALESKIKTQRMVLMVRIKNLLTETQQKKLSELLHGMHDRHGRDDHQGNDGRGDMDH